MALWPFRRKSARKRSRSGVTLSDSEAPPHRTQTDTGVTRVKSKKARKEATKLQRRPRTYSFSPGRHDSIRIDRDGRRAQGASRGGFDGHGEATTSADWERTPTLHLARRKSSKRRRDDHDREAEIKAMSAYMPPRSATEPQARSSSKQSTKRAKTAGFGHLQGPTSQVSLAYPASVRSTMSEDSEFIVAYKISVLDSLSPRPTLRYAPSTRGTTSRTTAPTAPEATKRPLGDVEPILEDPSESRKRIDELADELDAKDLRELMERDNRRRERKKMLEKERTEKRVARRAERHRKEKAQARKSGTPPPENLDRGILGRELVGLGIEPASTVITSSRRRETLSGPLLAIGSEGASHMDPLEAFHPSTSPHRDHEGILSKDVIGLANAEDSEPDEPISALPEVSRLPGALQSKKTRSKSTLGSDGDRLPEEESGRKNSQGSNKTASRMSIISWLKWGSKNKRNSGPSSFSNTSREEMQPSANPKVLAQAEALARLQGEDPSNTVANAANRSSSSVPKRTKSRFREDLPELPLSPPDSRVQSPEAEPPLPVPGGQCPHATSQGMPLSRHGTPPSIERSKGAQSTEPPLSMSLASIDSEASWLSGRVGSLSTSAKHESLTKANRFENAQPSNAPSVSTHDDLAITEDEYLSRLAPIKNSGIGGAGRPSGEGRPSSDGEESSSDDNVKWGRVGAKAEVVQAHSHDREMMRSRQGMLNVDSGDEEDAEMITPVSSGMGKSIT